MGKTRSSGEQIDPGGGTGVALNGDEPRWSLIGFDEVECELT